MKHVILATFATLAGFCALAQTGIGTLTPHPSAMLDVQSSSKGFLPPRMTAGQRFSISSPAEGLVVYDTDSSSLMLFDGTAWKRLGTGSGGASSSGWSQNGNDVFNTDGGRVGVGTSTPVSQVHISKGGGLTAAPDVFTPGDTIGLSGVGVRLFWAPWNLSFRAGEVNAYRPNAWDKDSVGYGSFAFGINSIVKGSNSQSFGINNTVNGYSNTVFGVENTVGSYPGGQNNFISGYANQVQTSYNAVFGSSHDLRPVGNGYNLVSGSGNILETEGSFVSGTGHMVRSYYNTALGVGHTMNWSAGLATGTFNDTSAYTQSYGYPLFQVANGAGNSARSDAFVVTSTGNAGIGVHEPLARLHVDGPILIGDNQGNYAPRNGMIRFNNLTGHYEGFLDAPAYKWVTLDNGDGFDQGSGNDSGSHDIPSGAIVMSPEYPAQNLLSNGYSFYGVQQSSPGNGITKYTSQSGGTTIPHTWYPCTFFGDPSRPYVPEANFQVSSIVPADSIFYLLGSDGGTHKILKYNPTSDVWSEVAALPYYFTAPSVVWTGTELLIWDIYALPGYSYNGIRYSPTAQTIVPISSANAPIDGNGQRVVWSGQKMYLFGGDFQISGKIYDPATDTWTDMSTANAPSARSGASMVYTGGKIVVFGGAEQGETSTNTGAVYNIATDSWTPMTTAAAPVVPASIAKSFRYFSYNGNFYVLGVNAAGTLMEINKYDMTANAWSLAGSEINEFSWNSDEIAASVAGNSLFVIGGAAGSGFMRFYSYDITAGNWTSDNLFHDHVKSSYSNNCLFVYDGHNSSRYFTAPEAIASYVVPSAAGAMYLYKKD